MGTIHHIVPDLIALLEEEAAIYGRIEALLKREQKALLGLEVSELGEIASQKEMLALRIKTLDESRQIMSARLSTCLGMGPGEVTVSALCDAIGSGLLETGEGDRAQLANRLDEVRRKLKDRAESCRGMNAINSRAARRGMELISGAIEHLLSEADPAGHLYQKKGDYDRSGAAASPALISEEA